MKKQSSTPGQVVQPSKLTSTRGEKISAVEGMSLTPRMRTVLSQSQGKSGDERRALVRAQFTESASEVVRADLRALDREEAAIDQILRAKIQEAIDDFRPSIPADRVFAELRGT